MRKLHSDYGIEEFQRGRNTERAKVVEWLRGLDAGKNRDWPRERATYEAVADAVERGEHFEDQ